MIPLRVMMFLSFAVDANTFFAFDGLTPPRRCDLRRRGAYALSLVQRPGGDHRGRYGSGPVVTDGRVVVQTEAELLAFA
ncbi:hypothetical protein [Halomicrococcus gelatinilyticus]|uniref:hypothetical protein n=1 Tax=Halomicrococcus gelatinilyticus TaxID=1702103 RepID=UPI002E0EF0FC